MKKYIKAKELLETNANKKEKKPIYATRKLSIGLVSCMLGLVMATPMVYAEGEEANLPKPQVEQPAGEVNPPQELSHEPEAGKNLGQGAGNEGSQEEDGFEIGSEIVSPSVQAAKILQPTITEANAETDSVTGITLSPKEARTQLGKQVALKVQVIVTDNEENVLNRRDAYSQSTGKFTAKLKRNLKKDEIIKVTVKIVSGDGKTVYGESLPLSVKVAPKKPDMNVTYETINMPSDVTVYYTGDDANAKWKLLEAIKAANTDKADFAKDAKSVTAYDTDDQGYVSSVTIKYEDNSDKKYDVTRIKLVKIVDSSLPTINDIKAGSRKITGKFNPAVSTDTDIRLYINVEVKPGTPYIKGKIDNEGNVTFEIPYDKKLKVGDNVTITVKEPGDGKRIKEMQKNVVPKVPGKTEVRDPKKLTDIEKKSIIQKIRDINMDNGTSLLPDGTGSYNGTPALIDFDQNGNARIIRPSNAKHSFDSNSKPIYEKNTDGTYKVIEEKEIFIIKAEDLLINVKPEKPTLKLSDDKNNIIITPDENDTDASVITVTYTGTDKAPKTTTATKAEDGTWSIVGEGTVVDGVVTLPKDKVKSGTDVKATVKDKGGPTTDQTPLTSEEGKLSLTQTKAGQVEELGGLAPVVMKKWVGDEMKSDFWKEGVKAKDSTKETEVNNLLAGATFTDGTDTKRSTAQSGEFEGKIKVKFDDNSELVVDKQTLYVSDLVTSVDNENVPGGALKVQFMLGEGVFVEYKDPNNADNTITKKGDKENPVLYRTYKVKPGTDLKTYIHPKLNDTVINLISAKADKGYTEPVWKNRENADDFNASSTNNVFTATATKTYDITFDANTGGGSKDKVTQKVNTEYELPAADTFTPPNENQVFSGWQVSGKTELKQPGQKIKITGDVVVKAIWKPKQSSGGSTGDGNNPNPGVTPGTGTPGTEIPETGTDNPENNNPETKDPEKNGSGNDNPSDPSKDKPGESGKDNPTDPDKNKPNQPGKDDQNKPGVKVPSRDDKNTPVNPGKGDKRVKKGDIEIVVPNEALIDENGKIKVEDRPKIVEKFKEKNPDVVDVKIHDNGSVSLVFKDGRSAELSSKDLLREKRVKIPKKQDQLGAAKRAGKNAKTGIESVAGVVCTLVASTGALYIGRKKED